MSKFFVGQRVRKVFSPGGNPPVKVGSEGVIESLKFRKKGDPLPNGGFLSEDNDIWVRYGEKLYSEVSRYVEPILPEGAVKGDFTFQQLMDELRRIEA